MEFQGKVKLVFQTREVGKGRLLIEKNQEMWENLRSPSVSWTDRQTDRKTLSFLSYQIVYNTNVKKKKLEENLEIIISIYGREGLQTKDLKGIEEKYNKYDIKIKSPIQ